MSPQIVMPAGSIKDLARSAAQSNKEHQYALKVYTERLQAELDSVDKLLSVAEFEEDEGNGGSKGSILIPGSKRPAGLLSRADLTAEDSPFRAHSERRNRFIELTEMHPMKAKELESLAEAVRTENYRIYAYESQRRGLQPFFGAHEQPKNLEINKDGLEWERIAEKVNSNSTSAITRTSTECEVRWLGDRHPEFNHTTWMGEEIAKARALVAGVPEGQVDWYEIAKKLGTNRTPLDCMRHTIPRATQSWTAESDHKLIQSVERYGTENWHLVARNVSENAQPVQCQHRYLRTLDPLLKKGNWTPEEDQKLRQAVAFYGHAWIEVASVIPGRNNEQCRDRYSERLNPKNARGKWTEEEDEKLLSAVAELGDSTWKAISDKVGTGRTDNMCRHRYQLLKKRPSLITSQLPAEDGIVAPETTSTTKKARRTRAKKVTTTTTTAPTAAASAASATDNPEAGPSTSVSSGELIASKPKPRPRLRKKIPREKTAGTYSTMITRTAGTYGTTVPRTAGTCGTTVPTTATTNNVYNSASEDQNGIGGGAAVSDTPPRDWLDRHGVTFTVAPQQPAPLTDSMAFEFEAESPPDDMSSRPTSPSAMIAQPVITSPTDLINTASEVPTMPTSTTTVEVVPSTTAAGLTNMLHPPIEASQPVALNIIPVFHSTSTAIDAAPTHWPIVYTHELTTSTIEPAASPLVSVSPSSTRIRAEVDASAHDPIVGTAIDAHGEALSLPSASAPETGTERTVTGVAEPVIIGNTPPVTISKSRKRSKTFEDGSTSSAAKKKRTSRRAKVRQVNQENVESEVNGADKSVERFDGEPGATAPTDVGGDDDPPRPRRSLRQVRAATMPTRRSTRNKGRDNTSQVVREVDPLVQPSDLSELSTSGGDASLLQRAEELPGKR